MGVLLYELVAGWLEELGARRAGEVHRDVPPWLNELIRRCVEAEPARRFRGVEEVSEALLGLRGARQG